MEKTVPKKERSTVKNEFLQSVILEPYFMLDDQNFYKYFLSHFRVECLIILQSLFFNESHDFFSYKNTSFVVSKNFDKHQKVYQKLKGPLQDLTL